MSKVSIEGNASGTGTFTIASPNSNTNRTLNLPDQTGTILTSATTTGFPAGSVLQVVQGTTSTGVNSTSTTYADTGLSASITPTSATSKILVVVTQPFFLSRSTTTIGILGFKVLRDSTTIYEPYTSFSGGATFSNTTSGQFGWVQPVSKLDSPATTSAITYKTQFKVRITTNSATARANADDVATDCESTIILMEIAG